MIVRDLTLITELPDPFLFQDGSKVTNLLEWERRKEEIASLYQYYMYGVLPDTSEESISIKEIDSCKLATWSGEEIRSTTGVQKLFRIMISKGDSKTSFSIVISFPAQQRDGELVISPPVHEGGYPVLIVIGILGKTQKEYLNDHSYVVIEFSNNEVAADNRSRTGAFYDLYPYGERCEEQTGTIMAWAWGVSKIIDIIEMDAASNNELMINPLSIIVTGVSRNGKTAAVAGAFDQRIRVTVPASSGAGGMTCFRYNSTGRKYDYSMLKREEFIDFLGEEGGNTAWLRYQVDPIHIVGDNEPLSNLQSYGAHWFNDTFLEFTVPEQLPFDQHFLVALTADLDRYYLITGEIEGGDWINPAGMYVTYLAARNIFDSLGIGNNIGIYLHAIGHTLTLENTKYLVAFCEKNLFGVVNVDKELKDLRTSIFEESVNYDYYFDIIKALYRVGLM